MDHQLSNSNSDLFRATVKTIGSDTLSKIVHWLDERQEFPGPVSVHLNLTLRCTARCTHCRQWTWPAHAEFNRAQLDRLFDVFSGWGVKSITFGGGNPLLFNEIEYALQTANQHGFSVGIISEGIAMTEALAESIATHAAWIRYSLDGPSPAIHDRIRNTDGLFDLVVKNIKQLSALKPDWQIGLNCVVQKQNYQQLSDIITLGERLGVSVVLFKLPHGDDPAQKYLLSAEALAYFKSWITQELANERRVKTNLTQLGALLQYAFREEDILSGKPTQTFYTAQGAQCFVPLFFVTCDSEGNVYPCDYLQADTRLWNGQYGQVRNEFRVGNILLEEADVVLTRLQTMFSEKIFGLPGSGYAECGCCTRFCQINAALSSLMRQNGAGDLKALLNPEESDTTIPASPFL